MTLAGWFEIGLTLALVLLGAYPIGRFLADVFENRRTFLTPIVGPVERVLYRVAAVDPEAEQKWFEYAISMVAFGGACLLALYALLRLQAYLPLNPQGFPGVPPGLAFNIAVSFITNTNWQAYAGETTLSHFSQMAGLTTQLPRFGGGDRDGGRADARSRSKRVADHRQFLGRYDPRDALCARAAFDRRRASIRGARGSANVERLGRRDDAGRRKAGHRPGAGRQPGSHQTGGRQRRRLLQRQFRASVREPERLVEHAAELEPARSAGGSGVRIRAHGRRLAAGTHPAGHDDSHFCDRAYG